MKTLLNGLKQQQRTRHPSLQWIFALPSGNKNKQKNKNSAYNRPLPVSPKPRLRSEAKRADLLQVDLLASGASLYWPRSGRLLKVYQVRSHWYKNDCLFSSKWNSISKEKFNRFALSIALKVEINKNAVCRLLKRRFYLTKLTKTLFTWSGGPWSSGVGFFCFVSHRAWKQKKPTPLDRGPPLHVNRPLIGLSKDRRALLTIFAL